MAGSISNKTAKLEKKGYSRFDADWLAIYDNLVSFEVENAARLLAEKLHSRWPSDSFHRIYIESDNNLIEITETDFVVLPLSDIHESNGS